MTLDSQTTLDRTAEEPRTISRPGGPGPWTSSPDLDLDLDQGLDQGMAQGLAQGQPGPAGNFD